MGSIVDGDGGGDSDLIDDCFMMHLRSTWVCSCGHTQHPGMEMPQLLDHVYVEQLIRVHDVRHRVVDFCACLSLPPSLLVHGVFRLPRVTLTLLSHVCTCFRAVDAHGGALL